MSSTKVPMAGIADALRVPGLAPGIGTNPAVALNRAAGPVIHSGRNRVVESLFLRLPTAFWPRHTAGKVLPVPRPDSRTLFPRHRAPLPTKTLPQSRPPLRRAVRYPKAPQVQKHWLLPTLAIYKKTTAESLAQRFAGIGLPPKPGRHHER